MTEMPELVAILHSFVGLAAVLVGFNSYLHHDAGMAPILVNIHLTEVFLGIFIGAVTFTWLRWWRSANCVARFRLNR